jgi:hypothetical protein
MAINIKLKPVKSQMQVKKEEKKRKLKFTGYMVLSYVLGIITAVVVFSLL